MFEYVCVGSQVVKDNHDRHQHHDESGCLVYCEPGSFKKSFYQMFKF